jgi:hypothetical protein
MKVQIRVEYWGRNRLLVRVLKDSVTLEQQQPATRATVEARRNRACERWSELDYEVEAGAIPDGWDITPGRGARAKHPQGLRATDS